MGDMSNLRPLSGQANNRVPTPPRGETIARYETYLEAQRAVDYLSDQQFPVQFVTIVGTGLRMVERVTGRLTYPRVAGASALSGLYFGFFVGLALSLFGGGNDLSIFAVALVGGGFGMLFGIISYALTGGRRDFTSTSQIVASEYEVLCLSEEADHARETLRRLPGVSGRGQVVSGQGPGGLGAGPGSLYGGQPGGTTSAGQTPGYPPSSPPPHASYLPPAGTPSPYGPPPVGPPAGQPAGSTPTEPAPAPLTGPTYGEMMERRRLEQRAQEAAEREAREAAERETAELRAAEREAARRAEQAAAEHASAERAARDRALHEPGSGTDRPDGGDRSAG